MLIYNNMEVKNINIIKHLFKEKPSDHGEYLLKHVMGIQRHNRKDKYHNGMDIINAADTCSLKKDKEATFLCIADTHGMLLYDKSKLRYEIEQKEGLDAVITLGDIRKDELYIICDTVAGGMPVYGVKGNHDDEDQFDSKNIMDINGHMVYINNVSIMHGWQHKVQTESHRIYPGRIIGICKNITGWRRYTILPFTCMEER